MASRSLGTLTVDLVAKIGGFIAGMDQAARAAEDRSKRIERTLRNAGRAIETAFAAIGVGALVKKIVDATAEQEAVLRQLEQRIISTGGAAGKSVGDLTKFAQSLVAVTTYSDDAIEGMQGLLLSFTNIRGDVFDRATASVLDLATALGTDLPSAARTIGLALNQPATGIARLTRAGVQLDESQQKLIKRLALTGDTIGAQNALLDALAVRYGGAARAAADTLGGSLTQLKNAFGEMFEVSGPSVESLTKSIKDLRDIISDPAILASVGTLTSALISGFSIAAEVVSGLVITLGGLSPFPFEEQINKLTTRIQVMNAQFEASGGMTDAWKEKFIADMDEAIRKLAALKEAQRVALGLQNAPKGQAAPAPAVAAPFATSPSEQFNKISDQLKQQIELYGQVGEAAKIAYQIQSGALDEMTGPEQQQLLALAKRIDALNETSAILKAVGADEKKLAAGYDSQLNSYKEQIGLLGQLTELEKLRFAIESGGLQGLQPHQAAYLESLAQQLDLVKELDAELAKEQDQREAGADVTKSVMTAQEQYTASVAELDKLLAAHVITQETYQRAVKKTKETLDKAADSWSAFRDEAQRNMQNILSDALVNGFDDGLKGMLASFADMLKKMAAQALAAKIMEKIFGTEGGGGGLFSGSGGGGGGLVPSSGNSWWATLAKFFTGRAVGGQTMGGQSYLVGERGPEVWSDSRSGYITPISDLAPAGGVNVQIVNPPTMPTVQQSQDSNGTPMLKIVFGQMADEWLGQGGGDRTMRGRYGLTPALGGRR